jgi:hypothetical protein
MATQKMAVMRPDFIRRAVGALIILTGLIVVVVLWSEWWPLAAQSGHNCSSAYRIDETLPTGARWEMCWEHRALEGIVLYDITFTPPGGPRRLVLAQAHVAQIHVPYDDNGARFHDVTDYGLGGDFILDLSPTECPGGALLRYSGKDVLCKQVQQRGYAQKYYSRNLQGYELNLFSVSVSGDYNYIPQWTFYDDGTIAPSMGAAGQLQRYGSDPQYGWRTASNRIPISHIHNYYYRLDFDIDGLANDLVEEIEFLPADSNRRRVISVTPLTTESGRGHLPERMRSWRIRDTVNKNSEGHPISYHLEAMRSGHDFIGPSFEPFTFNDLYVTVARTCEQYISHNPTTGGCGENVTQFVNGENTNGADVVVWYGVTFHHLPRDEDEGYMDAHWDGFTLIPRDWTAENPLDNRVNGTPPATLTPAATDTPGGETATPTATATGTQSATATPTGAPTATATGTAPPPTATATQPPQGCQNLLVNGDFELSVGWTFGSTPFPAGYVLSPVFAGGQALRTGIPAGSTNKLAYSSAYQRVDLPASAAQILITYWERPGGSADGVDYREALVLNSSYGLLRSLSRSTASGTDVWQQRTFDLTTFRGRTVVIYFNTYNNGSASQMWNYLDSVQLLACSAPAQAAAEPTVTPTPVNPAQPADALTVQPAQVLLLDAPLQRSAAISVTNLVAGKPLDWIASTETEWLNLPTESGQTPDLLNVELMQGGLPAGVYTGTVILSSTQEPSRTVAITVTTIAGLDNHLFLPVVVR